MNDLKSISLSLSYQSDLQNLVGAHPICSIKHLPHIQLWLLENKLWLVNTRGSVPYQSNTPPINAGLFNNNVNYSVQELPRREITAREVLQLQQQQELTWGNVSYYTYVNGKNGGWQIRQQTEVKGQDILYDYLVYYRLVSVDEIYGSPFLRQCLLSHQQVVRNQQLAIRGMVIFFVIFLAYSLISWISQFLYGPR